MRLHLIRHGQTDWNAIRRVQGQADSQLNELGQQQARELATALTNCPVQHVYCSSSLRTRQTAELLFAHRRLPISFHDGLREIFLGPWEGRLYSEIEQLEPEQFHNFFNAPHNFQLPGAENYQDLQQRAVIELQKILALHTDEDIAVVSHGALLKSLLTHLENKPLAQLWDPPLLPNCSHSIVELDKDVAARIIKYA